MTKRFWRRLWIAILLVAIGLPLAGWGAFRYYTRRSEARKLAKLVPAKVEKGEFVVKTQAAGVVEPENKVPIMPAFSGRIEVILVREGDTVQKGDVLAWMSSSERVALLDSAAVRGASAEEARMVDDAYRMIPLVAPIHGEVIKRAVEPGQPVSPNQNAFTVSDRLIVKTFVDESDIGKVRAGQSAEFILDAYLKERRQGKVVAIAYDSTTQNNVTVYEVKLRPQNGVSRMRSGMTAEVYIEIEKKVGVVFVPKRAVKHKEDGTVVMLAKTPGAPLIEQKVSLGASNEKFSEILSGVSAGDTVMMPSSPVPDEDEHVVRVK
ncbi:MAG: HlyD family efflux transporter periplasmic adaptor subunit [Elusimicrobia bacterium]|nr:HlyD family efflux transporter periplasmic adaptor subunit [Elusimicrobiota bacterium]